MMTTTEILQAAHDDYASGLVGWIQNDTALDSQGEAVNPECVKQVASACLVGMFLYQDSKHNCSLYIPARDRVVAVVHRRYGDKYESFIEFNNAPETTLADILSVLQEAAT